MRERLLPPDFCQCGHQDAGAGWYTKSRHACHEFCRLAHHCGIWAAVRVEDRLAQCLGLLRIGKEGPFNLHQFLQPVRDRQVCDHRLFGGADGGIIEGFRGYDVTGRFFQVCRPVHVNRHIPGTDAESRLPGRMGRPHHGSAAGRQDDGGLGMRHHFLGARQGDLLDAADQAFRSAGIFSGLGHGSGSFKDAACRRRVR